MQLMRKAALRAAAVRRGGASMTRDLRDAARTVPRLKLTPSGWRVIVTVEGGEMKLGVVFPQTEIGNDPAVIRDYAQTAEALGYNHVLAFDHVLGAHPDHFEGRPVYNHETPFHEPFVLFGYLAAVTRTLELVTGVLILPQRQTALVAKQAAAVDVLSGGRMRLGVGIGWNHVEYEALGENFRNRGRRIEEQIALMRRLWTEELVD